MQHTMVFRQAASETGVDWHTHAIDSSEAPLVVLTVIVHDVAGTSPQIDVSLETSENGEDWADVGAAVQLTAVAVGKSAIDAKGQVYGSMLRCKVSISGSSPVFVYSAYITTFPSS